MFNKRKNMRFEEIAIPEDKVNKQIKIFVCDYKVKVNNLTCQRCGEKILLNLKK